MKKRSANEMASVKSTTNQPSNHRPNVQSVFAVAANNDGMVPAPLENDYHEPAVTGNAPKPEGTCRFLPRLQGVENAAFQKQETSPQKPETSESEVYFADVSSCCNISVRNEGQDSSLYDEATENRQKSGRLISLQKLVDCKEEAPPAEQVEEEDYLSQRMANRQMSTRSRMPFPLPSAEDLPEFETDPCLQLLPKDMSQNSLCSSVQTPLTETTDDAISPEECCSYFQEKAKDQMPIHRGFVGGGVDQFLAPDAQYEVIPDDDSFSNLANTISGVSYYNQTKPGYSFPGNNAKTTPPKTLSLSQNQNRRSIGSNISALIQNLGGNAAGLLYGDVAGEDEVQGQGCHSDGTMDSGWQSDSEKPESANNCDSSRPVNV